MNPHKRFTRTDSVINKGQTSRNQAWMTGDYGATCYWPLIMVATAIPRNVIFSETFPVILHFSKLWASHKIAIKKESEELSDQELVLLTQKETKKFTAIIHRYEKILLLYIAVCGCEGKCAGELLQDIFVNAYVYLNEYDHSIPFSSWIYRLAHKEIDERLKNLPPRRESNNEYRSPYEPMVERITNTLPDCQHYTPADIITAVKQLESKYRDVMVLKYSEQKSSPEISDILEISQHTVDSLTLRAENKISAFLEKI